ncbi:MAG: tRNA (guanosine(46)-N7)-methyltransferase TrmB [Verrucomicrobiota bacterium]
MNDVYERLEFVPRNADYFQESRVQDLFDREAPMELDLGCGDGGFLMAMAAEFPDRNFIGVERLLGRVRAVCRKADRRSLENVRVLRLDSAYAVGRLLPKNAFSRVHLLFPDPWPKKKHQKRRIVTPEFVAAIHELLESGGEFLFKTDHEEYFEHARQVILDFEAMESVPWPDDAFYYAETDFERQWKEEGKRIQGVRVRKST